jgi:hypothetical protein
MTLGMIAHVLASCSIESATEDPEQPLLGLWILILLVAATGVLIPIGWSFIDNWRRGIAPAFVAACIGFVVGGAVAAQRAGWPHPLDGACVDETGGIWIAAALLCGGVGWLTGAVIGWFDSRTIRPSTPEVRRLWVAVALLALLATLPFGWPPFEWFMDITQMHPRGFFIYTRLAMFAAGTALVAVTLLVLAYRSRLGRGGAAIGAIVAISILIAAGMQFSSLLPLDSVWLNAWRMEQADAASFAPNVLTPASADCPGASAFEHGARILVPGVHRDTFTWLDGHVPRWLPDGFRLLTWGASPARGVWADGQCRLVWLKLWGYYRFGEHARSRLRKQTADADRVGSWYVVERRCPGGSSTGDPCLEYVTLVPEDRSGGPGSLTLMMRGVSRNEGDRIALGIPVWDPTTSERSL